MNLNQRWLFDCPGDRINEVICKGVVANLMQLRVSENIHPHINTTDLSEIIDVARALDVPQYHNTTFDSVFRKRYPIAASFGERPNTLLQPRNNPTNLGKIREFSLHCLACDFFLPEGSKPNLSSSEVEHINLLIHMSCNWQEQDKQQQLVNLDNLFPDSMSVEALAASIDEISNSTSDDIDDYRKHEALVVLKKLYWVYKTSLTTIGMAKPTKTAEPKPRKPKSTPSTEGHHLRPNGFLGGRGAEALPTPSAQSALSWLLNCAPQSDIECAAVLLTVLAGITGQSHDFLLNTIVGISHKGTLESVTFSGNDVAVANRHVVTRVLTTNFQGGASEVSTSVTKTYQLPPTAWMARAQEYLADSPSLKRLLEEKTVLKELVREHAPGFTTDKFRGAMIQAILEYKMDLPLTQLITGEKLQSSSAALNYLAFTKEYGEATINHAIGSLYDSIIPANAIISEELFGAPKAGVPRFFLDAPLTILENKRIQARKLKHPSRTLGKHQLLAEAALGLLCITSSHRASEALVDLTINDLAQSIQFVLHRDKRTSPDYYRRGSVYPDLAAGALTEYTDFLHIELKKRRLDGNDIYYQNVSRAVSGDGPLFFSAPGFPELGVNLLLEDLYGPNCPRDLHRHIASTELRNLGAPPALIESHLGHNASITIVGTDGVASPAELSTQLLPYLNRLFPIQQSKPYRSKVLPSSPLHKAAYFQLLQEAEDQSDRTFFWSKIKGINPGTDFRNLEELITLAINTAAPSALDRPSEAVITLEHSAEMRKLVLGYCHGDLPKAAAALTSLWGRLTDLREQEGVKLTRPTPANWFVSTAYPINRSHLAAFEQLETLRDLYRKAFQGSNTYDATLHAFVLFGNCPSYEVAREWISGASSDDAKETPEGAIIFPYKDGESRTISGVSFQVFSRYFKKPVGKPTAGTDFSWCGPLGPKDIEETAHYARTIEIPDLHLDYINDEMTSPRKLEP